MRNWIINLLSSFSISVGTRVRLPDGRTGTVTGGCVHVKLDTPRPEIHQYNVGCNLDKVKVL